MELLTSLMTLFMGSNYSREKILRRFSFTEFWEKLKTLPEIVCPMHDEFVRFDSKNECIEPVDDIIDKWIMWQSRELKKLIENPTPILTVEELTDIIFQFSELNFEIMKEGKWLNTFETEFWSVDKTLRKLKPDMQRHEETKLLRQGADPKTLRFYTEKMVLPVESKLTVWGDIHGSVHSLCRCLEKFIDRDWRLKDPTRYLIFLGDYVDRGAYSVEVLYILYQIKLANPKNAFLVRGDHEMPSMFLSRDHYVRELKNKYNSDWFMIYELFAKSFNYLPCALYLTFTHFGQEQKSDEIPSYMLFCHGGLELGYSPQNLFASDASFQLIESLDRERGIKELDTNLQKETFARIRECTKYFRDSSLPQTNGFLWTDFLPKSKRNVKFLPGRGFSFGEKITKQLMDNSTQNGKVETMFRGHQHAVGRNGLLWELIHYHGLVPLWSSPVEQEENIIEKGCKVYSLISCPSASLLFSVDTFLNIYIEDRKQWLLTHVYEKCKPSIEIELDPQTS